MINQIHLRIALCQFPWVTPSCDGLISIFSAQITYLLMLSPTCLLLKSPLYYNYSHWSRVTCLPTCSTAQNVINGVPGEDSLAKALRHIQELGVNQGVFKHQPYGDVCFSCCHCLIKMVHVDNHFFVFCCCCCCCLVLVVVLSNIFGIIQNCKQGKPF